MRNLLKFIATTLLLSPWMLSATTTPITTRVGSGSVCPGNDIIVPVTVQHCEQVGSISLVLSFDNTKVSYMGCQDFNDQFSSMILNQVDGNIYFAWAETNSVTLEDNDTIVSLRFNGIVGNTSLAWQTAQCEYTDTIGNVIPSNYVNGSINVYQSPTINSGPIDRTLVEGQSTTFEVSASGQGLSYQWRVLTIGTTEWVDLSNGGHYSNVNSWRLNVNNVDLDMSGNHYCCVVSGTCEPQVESDMALLLVTPIPHETLNTTAQSTSSCPYVNFAIPITVTNCDDVGAISLALHFDSNRMSYEGYQNPNSALGNGFEVNALNSVVYFTWSSSTAINIGNATLIELLFASESGNSSFQWITDDCEYSDGMGNLISTSFSNGSVTVYYPPSVTSHPSNRLVDQGANTNFSVGASGQGLSYQWQVSTDSGYNWSNLSNGGHYSNVNYYRLDVNNVQYDMTGYRYRCMVSGTCEPSAFSNSAVLTVRPTTIHTSVASASACPDTEFSVAVSVTNFNNVGAISLALNYNPDILTYTGYADVNSELGNGDLVINSMGGTVYVSWSSANGATIGNGQLFSLLFTGMTGSSGLQWNSSFCEYTTVIGDIIPMTFSNGNANIYQVAIVTGNPQDRCIYETQNTTFDASGSGQGLSYQWQVSTNGGSSWADLANGEHYGYVTSSTLRVNNATMDMNGYRYRCRITGSCGDPVYTESAELTVIVSQPVVIAENATWQCTGEVSQNIMVEYFNNVGAFSLVLTYDTNYLRYLEHFDLNSAMSSGDFVINYTMGKIYMTYSSANPLNLGSAKLLSLKFDSSGGNSTNSWQTNLCEVTDATGEVFNTSYVNGYINVFSSCGAFTDIDDEYWAYDEIMYLCNRGIVSGYQCEVKPERNIKRAELAKIAYLGLFNHDVSLVSDHFPSPFLDLQNTNTYYYRYAKALSYLEYGDGVAPFDRNKMNFNPEGEIERIFVIKALMEAYNIPPAEDGLQIFDDVPPTMQHYGYVNSAAVLGIIDDTYDNFRPGDYCTRAEAFVWLHHILTSQEIPSVNNSNYLLDSDFFVPGNYTPYNFSSILGDEVGNYNYTSKACFSIPGRAGMGLELNYFYSSFLTELPDQMLPTNPLGAGWSHSYNAYMINTEEVLDDYGNELAVPCLIVMSADGSIMVFDNENEPEYPSPITKGVYSTLRRLPNNKYQFKDKSQVVYVFEKINGAEDGPYMPTSITDRNGNAMTLAYEVGENEMPRLVSVTDPTNRSLTFSYKPGTNYLSSVSDPLNRSVVFEVENDNLVKYYNPAGDSISYYYQNNEHRYEHLLDSIILPKGNIIKNQYEQRKLVSTQHNDDIPTTITHQPSYSNPNVSYSTTMTEAIDETRTVSLSHQFDRYGNPIRVTENGVADISRTYSDPNDPTLLTQLRDNIKGITVSYEYDCRANITKTTTTANGIEIVQEMEYNDINDPVSYTDANGNTTYYYYTDGNLTRMVDALGNETNYSYDEFGQLTTMVNAIGVTTIFDYDDFGNCNLESIPNFGMTQQREYDLVSRLVSLTDAVGNTCFFDYDLCDNLISETDPKGNVTLYEYDKNDNLTAIVNAKGEATTYTYDFDDDLLLSESFQGISKYYSYNEDGLIKSYTNPNGNTFSYSYDEKGRITGNGVSTYSYYSDGQLQSVSRNGKSIVYAYDALNRVSSVAYDGHTIGYAYDNNSNLTKIVYPGGLEVNYGYDALNRLVSVEDWNHQITQYHYRPDNQLDFVEYPNQMVTTYHYDDYDREDGVHTVRKDGAVVASYSFVMDKNGNHLSETATEPYNSYPLLDWPDKNYTYNLSNRLLSDGVMNFEYDYNGNTTKKGMITYSYDVLDRLSSYSGDNSLVYGYDGLGIRRTLSRNDGTTSNYVMDVMNGANVLMEMQGSEVQCYDVYGNGLISRIKTNGETEYYVSDYRGSVVAMVDDSEEALITHRYQYDSWGNLIQQEESDFNPFRYVGMSGVMYDDSTLYYMRDRFYDPTIGRFISEDPIWSTNLYPYAENNPVMNIDPSGRTWVDAANNVVSTISAVDNAYDNATNGINWRKTATTVLGFGLSGGVGLVVAGVTWAADAAIDYYDRKIAEYDKMLAEGRTSSSQSQNRSSSGSSSNSWNPRISITYVKEPVVIIKAPYNPNSHIMDYLYYAMALENGTPISKNNVVVVHQTISKNLLQKRAYAKKKAYMQEKVKRYEHIKRMLVERMTR